MVFAVSLAAAIEFATKCLVHIDNERFEAEALLCHTLGINRSYLHAWPEQELKPAQWSDFEQLLQRRAKGEPMAYIRGRQEFWSLNLRVTEATLIPRPETEQVVELALQRMDSERAYRVADLGTGSGAIALAIASERPLAQVIATDISAAALEVAQENARRLGLGNVAFYLGDWFSPIAGQRFGFIVSNPPYVAEGDPHLARGDLRFEPVSALIAGDNGLGAIRLIAMAARDCLIDDGWLLLEHGYDQGPPATALLTALGYRHVDSYCDLVGLPRVVAGQWQAGQD